VALALVSFISLMLVYSTVPHTHEVSDTPKVAASFIPAQFLSFRNKDMAGTNTGNTGKKNPTVSAYIGTGLSPSLITAIEKAPKGVIADIVGVAHKIATKKGFSTAQTTELTDISLATAYTESGFKPKSPVHFDVNGPSVGLFQLHSLSVPSTAKATGGQLADVPGATIVQQEKNALNPVTSASVAISHIADTLAALGSIPSPGQVAAASQGPANPDHYASVIDALIPGGINLTEPDVKVTWPKNLSPTALATAPETGTNMYTGKNQSTSTSSSSGLLAKIGAFILAVVLIGVGLIIMAKSTNKGNDTALNRVGKMAAA
jgi:hypothetical protein